MKIQVSLEICLTLRKIVDMCMQIIAANVSQVTLFIVMVGLVLVELGAACNCMPKDQREGGKMNQAELLALAAAAVSQPFHHYPANVHGRINRQGHKSHTNNKNNP